MRKSFLLTAVLLLSCAWAVAQTSPSSSDQSTQPSTQSPSSTSPSSSQTSPSSTSPSAQQPDTSASGNAASSADKGTPIEGCLAGSSGSYTLTDASGTSYQLAGDTSKLADHVGHQVKIWGDSGASSASSTSASGSSAASGQTFNVKRVKMVASSCANK